MELPDGMMLPILLAVMLALLLPVVLRALSGAPSKRRAPTTLRPDAQARRFGAAARHGSCKLATTPRACSPLTDSPTYLAG
jgi:hypothetical protein